MYIILANIITVLSYACIHVIIASRSTVTADPTPSATPATMNVNNVK